MLPSKSRESAEVGIGGHHDATVLDCDRSVRVAQAAYSVWFGVESSTCAYIRTFTSGSSILDQRLPSPKRISSSCESSALGRSRSTPGRAWTPRTVTSRNGDGCGVSRCFSASFNVSAMKALTLMPRALAVRRTCLASWSSSDIVVLMMHSITCFHHYTKHRRREHHENLVGVRHVRLSPTSQPGISRVLSIGDL